ncbi:hypothetical protein KC19_4G209400 [Ceratodon purpureus]|uniref:Uncharacterized protein n=1 Tax=Ceratodon purpureus TaxID=3225 RepID=A0A8T0IB30_CERPU|nr:hypothetical protein KC19_4G209400 [Ceratodon purpureus]
MVCIFQTLDGLAVALPSHLGYTFRASVGLAYILIGLYAAKICWYEQIVHSDPVNTITYTQLIVVCAQIVCIHTFTYPSILYEFVYLLSFELVICHEMYLKHV